MKIEFPLMLIALAGAAAASDDVTIRDDGKGGFVATLTTERQLAIEVAQRLVLPRATEACTDAAPRFGRYRFESSQPVAASATEGERFEFVQEFTCGGGAAVPPMLAARTAVPDEELARLAEDVANRTRTLIASANPEMLESIHSKFSGPLAEMLPLSKWTEEQTSLHRDAGAMAPNPQVRVTTFIDPEGAPVPGVYLAVDFQARYRRAPYRCGYVMWLVDRQSKLSVIRLEDGVISEEMKSAMTPDQLAQTRQEFRCFAP